VQARQAVDARADAARAAGVFEVPLWRALAVFRAAALLYATVLVAVSFRIFSNPAGVWVVVGVMAVWTAWTSFAYARPERRGWPLLVTDLVVTAACITVSPVVLGDAGARMGTATIPGAWIAGPVVACAVSGGRRRGLGAAVLLGALHVTAWGGFAAEALDGAVILVLAGVTVGHVARLAVEARLRLQRAVEIEAATRERERLARGIHDSVLQVLALVQRRGAELGGEAAELGRLAGDQEAVLRELVRSAPDGGTGLVDLRGLLGRYATADVSLAAPAHPVWLPAGRAAELVEAVGAALSNVSCHAGPGARAWLLTEQDEDAVTVTVRDDGPGIAAGRLEEAAAQGRLGVAQSVRGRIRDLGGTVVITSEPGQGTEVELRVPRREAT